jgi:tRNA1Val (adenine37-N6)-methyltransferase
MSNSYFQFKQFVIRQDRCAMKVCTDACILGAWFSGKVSTYSRILDIGSGTGLLTLMLAQRNEAEIHGIELDPGAFEQLKENIAASEWNGRIRPFAGDVRDFVFPGKYDFMIVNPPFFEGDLNAGSEQKNLARHSSGLTLTALMTAIDQHLDAAGSFGILLPYQRTAYFEKLAAEQYFHLREKLLIRQTPGHDFFRSILYFSRRPDFVPATEKARATKEKTITEMTTREIAIKTEVITIAELTIKNAAGEYTGEFKELLADYYLYL